MALSNVDLKKHHHRRFVIEPWEQKQISPLGYDLRLGYVIDPKLAEEIYPMGYKPDKIVDITIRARQSVVVVTLERIYLTGRVIGTVHARSGISAKGILVNSVTVDPHWNGRLVLTFYNTSDVDIKIRSDKGMATLILHSVETETKDAGHKSETKQLLHDDGGRYTHKVINKILTYLNEYEDSTGEIRYQKARTYTKWFRNKSYFERKLITLKNDTQWYKIFKNITFYILLIFLTLLLLTMFIPQISTLPLLSHIDKNHNILSLFVATAALILSITNKLDSNGKNKKK